MGKQITLTEDNFSGDTVQELRCKIQKGIITRREFRSVSEILFEGRDLVS